ncbi:MULTISPECIES: hypothetical protein [unclassified Streptomyces]|uniref:hypothetical protein n=1 Tax=unclassified Streptomyces TaxID=2593676 RepID=UPI0033B1AA92
MSSLALKDLRRPSGLTWTVLRLHRSALLIWGGFVLATVATLAWTVWITADTALQERAYCLHHSPCSILTSLRYSERIGYVGTAACYSFLAVAAFAGGALIGRELENGTARLAWTQSVTPVRWLAAKLAVPATLITLGGTVLVVAYRWAWSAHPGLTDRDWTFQDAFVARGPLMVAYALCALALGTLTALVLRRALPALGVSLALLFALNFALTRLRWDLWPTLTRVQGPDDPFSLPTYAKVAEWGAVTTSGAHQEGSSSSCLGFESAERRRCLTEHGLTGTYVKYHPESHFWPLHLVETGIVLAVAAAATAAAFWLLRRRTA